MQAKTALKLTLLIIGIAVIIVSSMIVLYPIRNSSVRVADVNQTVVIVNPTPQAPSIDKSGESSRNMALPEQMNLPAQEDLAVIPAHTERVGPGLPIRLKIPKISVNALVAYVGLTSLGTMGVPKGPAGVAWFDLGSRPGESGSAVIAGHFGWKDGIPAVFDDLGKLEKGDKVYVEDEKGATHTFAVREIHTYGEDDVASEVFISSDGASHLNLVTCGGVWNKTKKSYSDRFVVFTDKVI